MLFRNYAAVFPELDFLLGRRAELGSTSMKKKSSKGLRVKSHVVSGGIGTSPSGPGDGG